MESAIVSCQTFLYLQTCSVHELKKFPVNFERKYFCEFILISARYLHKKYLKFNNSSFLSRSNYVVNWAFLFVRFDWIIWQVQTHFNPNNFSKLFIFQFPFCILWTLSCFLVDHRQFLRTTHRFHFRITLEMKWEMSKLWKYNKLNVGSRVGHQICKFY